MIYVGELWRYLYNVLPNPAVDRAHHLRVIAGNGLRPDIWAAVQERFGIESVVEHYGMTEMPAGPYMNAYGKVGACGYIPPDVRRVQNADKLIAFDVENNRPIRVNAQGDLDDDGFCVELTEPGAIGECIFLLKRPAVQTVGSNGELIDELNPHNPHNQSYKGYTDPVACAKRVYHNVFEKGDAWFATGDLLKTDAEGFFYFCDRIGDTYRWKGENVSTNEVGEVLCSYPGVLEANVYGVTWPGQDGKAGMASILLKAVVGDKHQQDDDSSSSDSTQQPSNALSEFDFSSFLSFLHSRLPSFSIPIFLRVRQEENVKTSTFKFRKVQFQNEGFNPAVVSEPLFVWDAAVANAARFPQASPTAVTPTAATPTAIGSSSSGKYGTYVPITPDMYAQLTSAATTCQ